MKKYFFQLSFFCLLFLGSFNLGLALQTFDGGGVSIVYPKDGTPILNYSLPDIYLDASGTPLSLIEINVYNNKRQLVFTLQTQNTSIELPNAQFWNGQYTVTIKVEEFTHFENIHL